MDTQYYFYLSCDKKGDKCIGDYHLIRLLTGTYKILVKALANRLKVVMKRLITEFQLAEVEGRLIQENILIAKELLNSRLKNGLSFIMFEIDFSKAFLSRLA